MIAQKAGGRYHAKVVVSILRTLEEHPIGSVRLEPALTVAAATPIGDVLTTMRSARIAHVLVVEEEALVGIFTERDLLMHAISPDGVPAAPVSEFMSRQPVTLEASQALSEVLQPMVEGRFRHLPIHDPRRGYIGVLTTHNLFQFIAELIPGTLLNLPPRPNQTLLAPEGA